MEIKQNEFKNLLNILRENAAAALWSKAVSYSRRCQLADYSCPEPQELQILLKDLAKHLSFTIYLNPEQQDWSCDCSSPHDPCLHVLAAAMLYWQGVQRGEPKQTDTGRVVERLRYQLHESEGFLQRIIQSSQGTEPLKGGLAQRKSLSARPVDFAIDHLLTKYVGRIKDRSYWSELFRIFYQYQEPLIWHDREYYCQCNIICEKILRVVEIKPQVFTLHWQMNPDVVHYISPYVAVDNHDHLRLLSSLTIPDKFKTFFSQSNITAEQADILFSELIPYFEQHASVTLDLMTHRQFVAVKPYVSMTHKWVADDQVELTFSLAYGDPAIAVVDHRGFVPLDEVKMVIRKRKIEQELWEWLVHHVGVNWDQPRKVLSYDQTIDLMQLLARQNKVNMSRDTVAELLPRDVNRLNLCRVPDGELFFEANLKEGSVQIPANQVLQKWEQGSGLVYVKGFGLLKLPPRWNDEQLSLIKAYLSIADNTEISPVMKKLCQSSLVRDLGLSLEPFEKQLFDNLKKGGDDNLKPISRHWSNLRPYQQQGVQWLNKLAQWGLGALLADEMGLGKTLQTLMALRFPALVMAPTSLLYNWENELTKWRPDLRAKIFHGSQREIPDSFDVLITSYGVVVRDIDCLEEVSWQTVVIDEAQTIKNPDTQVAQAVFRLSNAPQRIALTGTPVENSLWDLWSIFQFLNPGLLGDRNQFNKNKSSPDFMYRVRPFVLQRKKEDVAQDLPDKLEQNIWCELTDEEKALYQQVGWSFQKEIDAQPNMTTAHLLTMILRLRQICCHPALMDKTLKFEIPQSTKQKILLEKLLELKQAKKKALVFSQWTSFLDLIEETLNGYDISYVRLDGQTRDRYKHVERFQSDDSTVMLLSLKAGGVGLNLTAADHVFLMDPWWNPAVERQAMDRAHRMGQKNKVNIYRLIARDTIEEDVLSLQHVKAKLLQDIVNNQAEIHREDLLALLRQNHYDI